MIYLITKRSVSAVAGGAFKQANDYTTNLYLDGGRYGQPSVQIRFRIKKTFQGKEVSADPAERYDFTLQRKSNVPISKDEKGSISYSVPGLVLMYALEETRSRS